MVRNLHQDRAIYGNVISRSTRHLPHSKFIFSHNVQGWAKEWLLGCVNSPPAASGSQEEGFTYSFAQPCTPIKNCSLLSFARGNRVWIDLLRRERRPRHVHVLFGSVGVIWQRNHVFRPLDNIFALQLRARARVLPSFVPPLLSPGRRDHCLNTSPVKQDLVFEHAATGRAAECYVTAGK